MSQNWVQHALRNTPWRIQRQVVALGVVSVLIALIMGVLYLAQASSVATLGRQLEVLIAQRNQLEQTNEQLRSEIAQLRSVPRLLARAQELGFAPAAREQLEYLVVDGYNPNRPQTAASAVTEKKTEPAPVYDETFTGWLQQQWDALTNQFSNFAGREDNR
jgi:cell division protein FtsB